MTDKKINVRVAKTEDAAELLEIYAYYVKNTAITFEYEVPSLEEFEHRIRKILKTYPYLVAEMDGKIVGYAYISVFKDRAAYDWAAETSIYIHRDYKGMGIGRELYHELELIAKKQNLLNMEACIACPTGGEEDEYLTMDSVRFHEKCGYRLVGEFRKCGYKFQKWYSMVWMEKHIGEHKVPHPAMIPFEKLRR